MREAERQRFDELVEQVMETLPRRLHDLLEEKPLIVEDRPSPRMIRELGLDPEQETLCGLHSGVPLTERSVMDSPDMLEMIHIFRDGIVEQAGGWHEWEDGAGQRHGGEDAIREEIRITILHEIGHHFGLEEADLEELGYG